MVVAVLVLPLPVLLLLLTDPNRYIYIKIAALEAQLSKEGGEERQSEQLRYIRLPPV